MKLFPFESRSSGQSNLKLFIAGLYLANIAAANGNSNYTLNIFVFIY
jgi:hypothetical protein